MQKYNKAIVAILSGAVTLLAAFGIDVPQLTDATIVSIGAVLTPILVWLIPNKDPSA
jgi:hypothetical protein